jgi:ammonia channel protein AmtB
MGSLFYALKLIGWLRVTPEEEIEGLDITEHGAINYPEFGATVVGAASGKRTMMPDMVTSPVR